MQVYRHFDDLDLKARNIHTVVAFGSFDGLHQGHRMLLARVRNVAQKNGWAPAVLTFENHPLSILAPPYCPQLLMSPERKLEVLEQLGMDVAVVPKFTQQLSRMPAEQFIQEILVSRMGMRHIVCGYDCRFGHKGAGDGAMLLKEGHRLQFSVDIFDARQSGGMIVSSRVIRELISFGQVEKAMELLERPHELKGRVKIGDRRGRELGFPTLNLDFEGNYQVPANGVYAVWADVQGRRYGGMINLGTRPTFDGISYVPEAHLFNFNGDVYGETVTIYFIARLRDELKFTGPDMLRRQLELDRLNAQRALLECMGQPSTI